MKFFCLTALLAVTLFQALVVNGSVQEHIKAAAEAMRSRDLNTALEHYHAACSEDPKDYMNFFRRATAFMALGRYRNALHDLDTVLESKSDFTQARAHRADLLMKQGSFKEAIEDFQYLLQTDSNAQVNLEACKVADAQATKGEAFAQAGQCDIAIPALSEAIQVAPSSDKLRMTRAKCYDVTGQLGEAVGDVLKATKLGVPDTSAHYLLSRLYYKMGETSEALSQIRECVKLDDEHKECWKFYKHLKKFDKSYRKVAEAFQQHRHNDVLTDLPKAKKMENTEPFFVEEYERMECICQAETGLAEQALKTCTSVLQRLPDSADIYKSRAKAHETLGHFEACVQDLQEAVNKNPENQQLKQELDRAHRLLKQSKQRDYYKILGVPRNANKRDISKAYRKLANEWHPDKFQGEEEKKVAEQKFMDLRDAKEVLSDPEMRKMFDNGEDPLDAEQNRERQQHQHNPFHGFHGGNTFFFRH